jgi:hypothetical protein
VTPAAALAGRAEELADLRLTGPRGWAGAAADVAALARVELDARVQRMAEAYAAAASAVARCDAEREQAKVLRRRAEVLLEQATAEERRAAVRRAAGLAVPPEDDELRRAAHRLLTEADEVVAAAERRAAAELDALRPARSLTLGQQAVGFARGAWTSVLDMSQPARLADPLDLVRRPRAHVQESVDLVRGLLFAAEHPRQAAAAAAGLEQVREGQYGEWLGGALAATVLPGGRLSHVGERLAFRAVEAGGPVVVRAGLHLPAGFPRHIKDLTPQRRVHILDGDDTGGGHRAGTGIALKSEFPADWTDDEIIDRVMKAAQHPYLAFPQKRNRFQIYALQNDVSIKIVVEADGTIVTAHPIDGPGVVRNPRRP